MALVLLMVDIEGRGAWCEGVERSGPCFVYGDMDLLVTVRRLNRVECLYRSSDKCSPEFVYACSELGFR